MTLKSRIPKKAEWDVSAQEYHQPSEDETLEYSDDHGEGFMKEAATGKQESALMAPRPLTDNVTKAANGTMTETFSATWRAEYAEDPDSGLWRVDVFNHDVPEWCGIGLESLGDAMQCARDYNSQL